MGRSFSRAAGIPKLDSLYHARSERRYDVVERSGRWFLRREQAGYGGSPDQQIEREIHPVVGSGNHARTYLHRTGAGALVELPVSWYAESGGWGMSPGYDAPNHQDFRRRISDSCLFCHNGYPAVAGGGLAEGIDCQRCHGPGAAHVRAAESGSGAPAIRSSIVNPARLEPQRRLEVCLQCHLETTSRPLPNMLRRYGRAPFSYIPGEPLGDYALHFDHPAGAGHDDKVEINGAGYRFLKSRCYTESKGALTCVTCHDPHDLPRGEEAVTRYSAACAKCHGDRVRAAIAAKRHPAGGRCVACHMPRRRTEDAVHVVMTDHWIQRRPPERDLLAPLDELETARAAAYSGPVELFYPRDEPGAIAPDRVLYTALAQVKDLANLGEGLRRLASLLSERPAQGELYFDLGEANRVSGRPEEAAAQYGEAIRLSPGLSRAHAALGETLLRLGRVPAAVAALERGQALGADPAILVPLGVAYGQSDRMEDSVAALEEAVRLDPDHPGAWLNLAVSLEHRNDAAGAERAYRAALRAQPDVQAAHTRLAALLETRGRAPEAVFHRERARIEADKAARLK
jgi:Flp pilus assembly protein TadD